MLPSILIAIGLCGATLALTWFGFELTFRPVQNDEQRRRARISIGVVAVVLLGLTIWGTVRNERESREQPKRIAEYIRNTTPPPGLPQTTAPLPPTGLVVAVDGDWGATAIRLAEQITNFLRSQGEQPSKQRGESNVDFIVRSNIWYSNVMIQYKKQYSPQVITLVGVLADSGALKRQVAELAKDPINVMGVQAIATELDAGGRRYRDMIRQNARIP